MSIETGNTKENIGSIISVIFMSIRATILLCPLALVGLKYLSFATTLELISIQPIYGLLGQRSAGCRTLSYLPKTDQN